MFFTRVVEIDDMILPPNQSHPQETDDDYESDEADVHGLVRVTMITRRKRINGVHVPDSGSVSALAVETEAVDNKPASSLSKDIRYYPRAYAHSSPGRRRRGSVDSSSRPAPSYYSSGYPARSGEPLTSRRLGITAGGYTSVLEAKSRKGRNVVVINHSVPPGVWR